MSNTINQYTSIVQKMHTCIILCIINPAKGELFDNRANKRDT